MIQIECESKERTRECGVKEEREKLRKRKQFMEIEKENEEGIARDRITK